MQTSDLHSTLQQLQSDHQQADQRLRELDLNLSLTPDEQVEIVRLKKLKLRLKDEIRTVAGRIGARRTVGSA